MRVGAIFCLIVGILECILIYVFGWFTHVDGLTIYYGSGVGLMKNLPYLFTNAPSIAAGLMMPTFAIYFIAAGLIFFLASPIFILIGIKKRFTAIMGSIMPILMATALLLGHLKFPEIFQGLYFTMDTWVPIYVNIYFQGVGIYLMGIGGIVGFVGGILGRGPHVVVGKGRKHKDMTPEELEEAKRDEMSEAEAAITPAKIADDPVLQFPLDLSELPEEVLKPGIYVPIESSKLMEVVPPGSQIVYSTLMSGVYTFGPLKETWSSHVLITDRGLAFTRPTIIKEAPPNLFFAPWNRVLDPWKGRISVKISALAIYYFKLLRDPNLESKESFDQRFKEFGGKFRPLKKAFKKQWKVEKRRIKAEKKAEKIRLKEEKRRRKAEEKARQQAEHF